MELPKINPTLWLSIGADSQLVSANRWQLGFNPQDTVRSVGVSDTAGASDHWRLEKIIHKFRK